MPRPRKSRERHVLQGDYRPSRHGSKVDHPPLIAEPPARLTDPQKEAWRDLAIAGRDYLAESDVVVLEVASKLLAESREPAPMPPARISQLARFLARLGLDPTARGAVDRVTPPEEEEDNQFFQFKEPK